jgi:signal transduction histidine kinase
MALGTLIGRSLAEVRLSEAVQNPERFLIAELLRDVAASATLEADAKGLTLIVMPVDDGVAVEADRQVLAAAVGHLLQNAFKFTRRGSTVTLRIDASTDRVRIEVQDECGGLPGGDFNELFRLSEPNSANRGLGLGLPFSRWAIEANHGRINVRNLPDKGCVFTVDLPRLQTADQTAYAPSAT